MIRNLVIFPAAAAVTATAAADITHYTPRQVLSIHSQRPKTNPSSPALTHSLTHSIGCHSFIHSFIRHVKNRNPNPNPNPNPHPLTHSLILQINFFFFSISEDLKYQGSPPRLMTSPDFLHKAENNNNLSSYYHRRLHVYGQFLQTLKWGKYWEYGWGSIYIYVLGWI